jgi:hypothetical protein
MILSISDVLRQFSLPKIYFTAVYDKRTDLTAVQMYAPKALEVEENWSLCFLILLVSICIFTRCYSSQSVMVS